MMSTAEIAAELQECCDQIKDKFDIESTYDSTLRVLVIQTFEKWESLRVSFRPMRSNKGRFYVSVPGVISGVGAYSGKSTPAYYYRGIPVICGDDL